MAKYLTRSCPRCNGYLGIVLRQPARNTLVQAINGQCLECGYGLAAWILVRGKCSLRGVSVKSAAFGVCGAGLKTKALAGHEVNQKCPCG